VNGLGAIQAQTNKEVVLRQKLAPIVVQQSAIGLQGIGDFFSLAVLLLVLQGALEEFDAHQGRFSDSRRGAGAARRHSRAANCAEISRRSR